MTQNAINQNYMTVNAGTALLDMTLVNANAVISTSGQNNLYTVPVGRRALISAIYCNSQGSVNATPTFSSSGTYYNGGGSQLSLTAGTPQNILQTVPLILDSGEILAVFLSGAVSVNCWPVIVEFASNSGVKSGKAVNMVSGNNLCYTCPSGKTACILDRNLNFGGISATAFSIQSSTSSNYFQYVPSGQSPGSTFRITNNVSVSGTSTNFGVASSSASRAPSLGPGDAIWANCSIGGASVALFNVVEF